MDRIHVAVGVVKNARHQVLLSRRRQKQHLAGCWEFPGGKVEMGESGYDALRREFKEEVNLEIQAAEKCIAIPFDYPEQQVLLDVYLITDYSGQAEGMEQQEIDWVDLKAIENRQLPAANKPILTALNLPNEAFITGEHQSQARFFESLVSALETGIELVQIRSPLITEREYVSLCEKIVMDLMKPFPWVKFFANCSADIFPHTGFEYWHLSGENLRKMTLQKPAIQAKYTSAAVHAYADLKRAEEADLDFVYLSSVNKTRSKPQAEPLGWQKFSDIVSRAKIPVYALGGMTPQDIRQAKRCGAQGVAGISAYGL